LSIVPNDFLNFSFLPLSGSTKSVKRELASPLQTASRPRWPWQTRFNQQPTSLLDPVVLAALSATFCRLPIREEREEAVVLSWAENLEA
jgi:hypothetical protein